MSSALTELRRQLREHFPEAHLHAPAVVPMATGARANEPGKIGDSDLGKDAYEQDNSDFSAPFPITVTTGVPILDRIGIPAAAITELVAHHRGGGVALLTHTLLQAAARDRRHLALIDSQDHFDPGCADVNACSSVLWLRCEDLESSLKAADLLLRDGNLPLIIADFQLESPRALRAVALSSWHRLRALTEKTGSTIVVFTSAPVISTARLRVEIEARFSLDSLQQARTDLLADIPLMITRRIGYQQQQRDQAVDIAVAS